MKMHPKGQPIGLGILIAGIASFITSAQIDPITARVERVMDGDTVCVGFEVKGYTVRLIGVDTPETKHPHPNGRVLRARGQRLQQGASRR